MLVIQSCSPKAGSVLKNDELVKNIKMNKLIAYKDGNNNIWEIKNSEIQYKPVSRNESSSGEYSGGKNRNITISPEQYAELQQLAQRAFEDKTAQLDKRAMGSALLIFEEGQLILKMNAQTKNDLDNFFKSL